MKRVQYDITTECNLECEICYLNLEKSQLEAGIISADLETHSKKTVIAIGGGEPFLHSELEGIINDILEHGNLIHLSTNATIILDWFYKLPQEKRERILVQASLLAASEEKYSQICKKNCLNQAKENIKKLSQYYKVLIHTVLYKGNLSEVQGLLRISQQLQVPIHFGLVIPIGKAKNVQLLDKEDIGYLRDLLEPYVAIFDVSANFMTQKTKCPVLAEYYPFQLSEGCPAPNSLYINPKCEIKNCVFGG